MCSNRRKYLAILFTIAALLPVAPAAAEVNGITYAGSNCIGSDWEAEHFAARGLDRNWTSVTAGVNSDRYKCGIPSRSGGTDDFGVRATMAVRGPADCVLWVADQNGFYVDASFASTGSVAPATPQVLTFDLVGHGLDQDAVFTIDCQLPNGSAIDAYTFAQCLDVECDANVCGNGLVEVGEQCDDGNSVNDDTCSNSCIANCSDTVLNCGGPCTPCQQKLLLSAATAGGPVQTAASNAIDGSLATRYTNDGALSSASIQLQLAQAGVVNGLRLAMYQGGVRTYPLSIKVNGTQVFAGSTQTAADYWNVAFPAISGDNVTITMTGPNSVGQSWFSIWEAEVQGYLQPSCNDSLQNQGETGVDCGGPCSRLCGEQQLEIFTAVAGGSTQTPAAYAIDGNTSTRYTNDGALATASLTIQLQQAATIGGLQLLMYNGSNRTYPIQVKVGNTVVFTGSTAISAGYWPLSFAQTLGDKVTISMTGPNSAGQNWLSIFEAHVRGIPLVTGPASCSDGVQTPGEDGIDCGGLCPNVCIAVLPPVSATSSSAENSSTVASKAIDGNLTTRWSSAFSNPQWLSVDLGASRHIEQVNVQWENSTSTDYDIQVSNSGSPTGTWTTLRTVTNPASGARVDRAKYLGATGRYVRIYSRSRSTSYGNSIYELETLGY